ncbi:MAG: hypothetical protein Q7S87_13860 [Agitococcus sp.]|nr:hypothetical protein [Agitococcus sp.]
MAATKVIGPHSWQQSLTNRDRDFKLFRIPGSIVNTNEIKSNTKRNIKITLSTGKVLQGFCSVTSGTEIYIPKEFSEYLKESKWFDCDIIGNNTGEKTTLEWV